MKLLIQQKIQAGFAVALVFLLLTGAAAWWSAQLNVETFRRVDHTHEVLEKLNDMLVEMLGTETGSRGFAISGDEKSLAPYQAGIAAVHKSFAAAKQLTQDNPNQQRRLAALDPLIQKKINFANEVIQLRRSGDATGALQLIAAGQGKQTMDEIRKLIAEMEAEEGRLLQQRTDKAQATARTTIAIVVFGSLLAVGLVGLASVIVRRDFEKRQQAEAALRRSEESLAVTLHSIGDAVLATDTEGRVTRLNPIAEQLMGWTQTEALGRPVAEVFRITNETTRQPSVIPVDKVLATGKIHGLANHTILIARDGTERPIADSAAPIRDKDGRVLGVVLVFRDVTAERDAQRVLRESEARYRTLFDSIDEGFCIIEMIFDEQAKPVDFRFVEINPSFEKQSGLHEAVGKRMREFAPQHEAYWFEAFGRVAMTGEATRFQNRAEQLQRSYDVYAFRLGNPEDRRVAILFSNITERKQAEAALEHERYLLRTLMDNVPADIYFKDRAGRFLRNNRAHTEHFGLTDPAQAVGRTDFDFFSEEHARQAHEDEQQVMSTGQPITKEEKETWPDGQVTWVLTSKLPLRDETQQIVGTFGVSHDITERKRAEDAVRQLNADLQKQTAQLESANKELEAFSYSVSHDLRAPLRHIEGYVELAVKHAGETLNEKSRRHLNTVAESVAEMGQLIDDLLEFSRMGRVEMQQTTVDSEQLVQETLAGLERETQGRNIVWKRGPLPSVQGDPAMLKQVFVNLIANAVKYTRPRDPAQIEIGCASEAGGEVVIFVRDNGVGFDMKYVDKLFGVFQRLHHADEFEGTGVGLANVRRIITRHGGRIWAEAAVNGGAAFHFTLTRAQKG